MTIQPAYKTLLFITSLIICSLVLTSHSTQSFAAIEAVQFDNPATMLRYQKIISELRCLVCQNQNLADSNAGLAKDLRLKTEEMLRAGKSDQEILDYMRDRYGDFVLYRPPFSWSTAIIWLGPFLLLLIVTLRLLLRFKQRKAETDKAIQTETKTQIQARELIEGTPELNQNNK